MTSMQHQSQPRLRIAASSAMVKSKSSRAIQWRTFQRASLNHVPLLNPWSKKWNNDKQSLSMESKWIKDIKVTAKACQDLRWEVRIVSLHECVNMCEQNFIGFTSLKHRSKLWVGELASWRVGKCLIQVGNFQRHGLVNAHFGHLEFQEVAEPKDPQLCRQINDYNLTISWNSGFTQFYNQCFLAFLGSVQKLCKVDFDPLCTFSYFLIILTISLPISSDLWYVRNCSELFETFDTFPANRLPVLLQPGGDFTGTSLRPPKPQCGLKSNAKIVWKWLSNASECLGEREHEKICADFQSYWDFTSVMKFEDCWRMCHGGQGADKRWCWKRTIQIAACYSTVSTCNYYEGGPIHYVKRTHQRTNCTHSVSGFLVAMSKRNACHGNLLAMYKSGLRFPRAHFKSVQGFL